jgi:type IV secretion system protein VirB9
MNRSTLTRRLPRTLTLGALLASALAQVPAAHAETVPPKGLFDERIRTVAHDPDDVIRLTAFVGYQIHFQFAPGEEFVNLGTGDRDGIDVGKEANHLFIKPRVEKVGTNITVLTTRRAYHLHYTAVRKRPDPKKDDVIYSIRFTYPQDEARDAQARREKEEADAKAKAMREAHEQALTQSAKLRARNEAYEFCGTGTLKPVAAFDDGVQTRLRFAARTELPAVFVKNDDGTESLVNLNVDRDEVVLHRVARQWVLRRGALVGCVRNTAFEGSGVRLDSGTVHPAIERAVRRPDEPSGPSPAVH